MKYPQSLPMPRDVQDWLEGELEARGIDAVVYTRYILSLMQRDEQDTWPHLPPSKAAWSEQRRDLKEADDCRSWDHDALKRLAVVRCLMSASGQKCEMESLVDELCVRLKEIQNDAADEGPVFLPPSDTPPYADYNKEFPPLQVGLGRGEMGEESCVSSAWTRGLLRASLDKTDTALPYDDTLRTQHCFSLMYCGPRKIFGNEMELLSEQLPAREDVKRLYERSADHSLDRVIARLDSTIQEIWNPDSIASANADPPGYAQNQVYFYNNHQLFSPTLFAYGHLDDVVPAPAPLTSWSLGGTVATTLPNHKRDESCFKEVTQRVVVEDRPAEASSIVSLTEEEDLLTSARTHFRPIPSEDLVPQPPVYADGTTFPISTELEPLPFQRSESGTLFLETGKYMEFKQEDDGEPGVEEFVPKFRVRQSNEKFCQTEEAEVMLALSEQVVPDSPQSPVSESDDDEFFFPGDDELALDLNTEDLPAEDEVAQIVSGRLDVRWKAVETSALEPEKQATDMEPTWDTDDAALVDELVDEETEWKQDADCNFNTLIDPDDSMEGVVDEDGKTNPACWLHLTDSIWNPKTPPQACETCKQGSAQVPANKFMTKHEWQEIWGQPVCKGCKEDVGVDGVVKGNVVDSESQSNCKVSFADGMGSDTNTERSELPGMWKSGDIGLKEVPVPTDWNSFGPIGNESAKANKWDTNDTSPGWKWPKLGAALSAYLEESRVRAFEMLTMWSPVQLSGEAYLSKKPSSGDLRGLWSPATSDEECGPRMTAQECREIWSPGPGQQVGCDSVPLRPLTYSLLREELSEDGDQLLSDLSCLHLHQLGVVDADATEASDIQEEDTFPTAPPSPEWDKSHRFVSLWATCNVIEIIGDNIPNLDERPYNSDTAQKERKRRHSSSQKMCELYMEGECRRPHCRFLHGEDGAPSPPFPLFSDASAFAPHTIRFGRELHRAFTL